MTFNIAGFCLKDRGGSIGGAAGQTYCEATYITADAVAMVLAAGYFNAAYTVLPAGTIVRALTGIGSVPVYVDLLVTASGASGVSVAAQGVPQVNSDWNATSGVAQILNKPVLATVATTGSYTDLLDIPTVPVMKGASTSAPGISGLVPAPPTIDNQLYFLRSDGLWGTPTAGAAASTNISFSQTSSAVALISSTGIGATLPAATSALAGVLDAARAAKIDQLGPFATLGLPLTIINGGTGQTTAAEALAALLPFTAPGDLLYRANGGPAALGIGGNGSVLGVSNGLPAWLSPNIALAGQSLNNVARLGIGVSDSVYLLSVYGGFSLFANNSDCAIHISKGNTLNSAYLRFEKNYSGRAQLGLCNADTFSFWVSPDGSTWMEGLLIDLSGVVSFPNTPTFTLMPRNFASLPASPAVGTIACVTDAPTSAVGSSITGGGGSSVVLVWYNGAHWLVFTVASAVRG